MNYRELKVWQKAGTAVERREARGASNDPSALLSSRASRLAPAFEPLASRLAPAPQETGE